MDGDRDPLGESALFEHPDEIIVNVFFAPS